MSTIPTPSSTPYTVIGNSPVKQNTADHLSEITLIVLSQGSRFQRIEYFEKLSRMGWAEIISVENQNPSYDVETLTSRIPGMRCMVFHEEDSSSGEKLNMAIRESLTSLSLVIWSTMMPLSISPRQIEEMCGYKHAVVTIPLLRTMKGEIFPSIIVPAHYQQGLKTLWVPPGGENKRSLFPFQYTGLYRKDLFLSLMGFDPEITSAYWQKMDFGLRAYLWGMGMPVCLGLRIQLQQDPEPEDSSPHRGSLRFYLKNLAVDYHHDHGTLEWKVFLDFYRRSGLGLLGALKLFKQVRHWVVTHGFRYTSDARRLVELWDEDGLPE